MVRGDTVQNNRRRLILAGRRAGLTLAEIADVLARGASRPTVYRDAESIRRTEADRRAVRAG